MSWLLYPLVRFGRILYENELPGRPRTAGVENAEVEDCGSIPESSTPETATLEVVSVAPHSAVVQTAVVDVPESIIPELAASTTMKEELAHGHDVLFDCPIAGDQKRINTETMAQRTSLSAEVRAYRRARRRVDFLRATILTREDQLEAIKDRLEQIADEQGRLRDQDHLLCIDPRLFRLSCIDARLRP